MPNSSRVRSVVCRELGSPASLTLEQLPRPPLGPGQIRVGLRASGVNFPDLLMVAGQYQHKPPLPFTPGLEGAGVVTETAPDVDAVRVGDEVIAWQCLGTYADEIVVPAERVVPKPRELSFEQGAAFLVGHVTAYHALVTRARLAPGEVLLVLGAAGGVGLAAVQIARSIGATVIAAASSADKLAVAQANGADHLVNYLEDDIVEATSRITGGQGADVIYDPVGGASGTRTLRCLRWGGRLLIVGFAAGQIPTFEANRVLLRGCSVIGVRAGEAARRDPDLRVRELAGVARLADTGGLRPVVSHLLPLEEWVDAMHLLRDRTAIGRVVLTMRGGS